MKVLIVSEGKHELGVHAERKSPLEQLVRRLCPPVQSCEFLPVTDSRFGTIHGKHGRGMTKKGVRVMLAAHKAGYDAVVLLVDEDGFDERIKEMTAAQENTVHCGLPRALGVAVKAFDAWILADNVALSKVLAMHVATQARPETNQSPKESCQALLEQSDRELSTTDLYHEVAAIADTEVLTQRCPLGFAPFAARVRGLCAE